MKQVIPVVVINELEQTESILGALMEGGLPIAEITFRTPCAAEAIRLGCRLYPTMSIGAGTIINKAQCIEALQAGAQFIVSPGFSPDVALTCSEFNVPYYPGCVTPCEIMCAMEFGIKVVKFFPASVYGGLKAIKALAAPFSQIQFIPTGGIDMSNLAEYLACDKIYAVGGSFMMKGDIVRNCKEIVELCKQ